MYILDTNIYIDFYDRYYIPEVFQSFWNKLPNLLNNQVIIPAVVKDEIIKSEFFKAWLSKNYTGEIIDNKKFYKSWSEVLTHIQNTKFYSDLALTNKRSWAHEKIADGWIIAIAKEKGYTIVTSEVRKPILDMNNPTKDVRIPDICDQLGIKCINRNEFFKEVNLVV